MVISHVTEFDFLQILKKKEDFVKSEEPKGLLQDGMGPVGDNGFKDTVFISGFLCRKDHLKVRLKSF